MVGRKDDEVRCVRVKVRELRVQLCSNFITFRVNTPGVSIILHFELNKLHMLILALPFN